MKRILIADPSQFGYHVDTYKYARLLQGRFDITFICWDFGLTKLPEQETRVIYVSRAGNKVRRLIRYISGVLNEMRSSSFDLVLVVHFPFCSLLRLLQRSQTMVIQIVTGYVRDSRIMKLINDTGLYCESLLFKHVAVQSESLRRDLHISPGKSYILPVGADEMNLQNKTFDAMRLFYVGTLDYRHIDETVRGFARFYEDVKDGIEVSYDIVGFGSPEEERKLAGTIEETDCSHLVRFYGRVPHDELTPFLERNNIGVAFIPMKRHFDCQPATKVFEYLLSGMAVLATATKENALVINASNGVLVGDNADAVYRGLQELYKNRGKFDSRTIKESSRKYSWHAVICDNLETYLNSLIRTSGQPSSRAPQELLTSPNQTLRN